VNKVKEILEKSLEKISNATSIEDIENIRIDFIGKKGQFTNELKKLRDLPANDRPLFGQEINKAKNIFLTNLSSAKNQLEGQLLLDSLNVKPIDVSLAGANSSKGSRHPISLVRSKIEQIFKNSGYKIKEGPEIEDDYHNFTALNVPENHPARAMHDTFYFEGKKLLRTHTSPVQIRSMIADGAPIRIIAPGKCYRCDSDQTHTPMFHQVEGLVIDENISFANLKAVLHEFVESFFERELQLRFRPSYFPFTEPSAEVDILWENDEWLEILGCGMVHPNVLTNSGIDPEKYSGYAFGMGVERLAMLYYGVRDLRTFYENDINFLKQFS
tara:strand:- start:2327 stop:3310 length:984 start_codon:yes stop_codon:yes gene_type:complete